MGGGRERSGKNSCHDIIVVDDAVFIAKRSCPIIRLVIMRMKTKDPVYCISRTAHVGVAIFPRDKLVGV